MLKNWFHLRKNAVRLKKNRKDVRRRDVRPKNVLANANALKKIANANALKRGANVYANDANK